MWFKLGDNLENKLRYRLCRSYDSFTSIGVNSVCVIKDKTTFYITQTSPNCYKICIVTDKDIQFTSKKTLYDLERLIILSN